VARLWRVWHEALPRERGAEVELERDEAHHVARVLRLARGESLALFDGRGSEWRATLVETSGRTVRVRLAEPIDAPAVEPALEVALYQALLKPERMDWVIQKATELGVSAVRAFPSERSEGARAARVERWRRIAVEACKQSGRRTLPAACPVPGLPAPEAGCPGWILDPAAALPVGRMLAGRRADRLWLATGPEGGFSGEEVGRATGAGWIPVSLGPRVLRAETAGLVALALVMHRWGDLGAD
jgi:16S rRNA (uracil1498-N3)-methyltransferase